jgi:hypothetical protein
MVAQTTKPVRKSPVDDATILALTESGKTTRQIESITGAIDHATVARRLKHLTPRKTTEIFKGYRADIFAELQRKIIDTCDHKSIKKMHPRDRFLAMGLLYDKERIERGLSDNDARPLVVIQIRGQVDTKYPVDDGKTVDVGGS